MTTEMRKLPDAVHTRQGAGSDDIHCSTRVNPTVAALAEPWDFETAGDEVREVEADLISAALEAPKITAQPLTGTQFLSPKLGAIWDAIRVLDAEGRHPDPLGITETIGHGFRVDRHDVIELMGRPGAMPLNAPHYVDVVRNAWAVRDLVRSLDRARQQVHQGISPADVIAGLQTTTAGTTDTDAATPSWQAIDLSPYLDGTHQAPVPEYLPRTDGVALFYPGLVHSLHGESESGKSLVVQAECVRLINIGVPVLYLDYESDPASILERMRSLGATDDALQQCFAYVQPDREPDAAAAELRAFLDLIAAKPYALAVIDGVSEALSQRGGDTNSNDDITAWHQRLPRRIASRTGAAVALIDHVTKNTDGRGRFALGGQAKMAALTGAAYVVEVSKPLGRGMRGEVVLRVAKDRPGYVRGQAGAFRASDRTQEVARVTIDGTGDNLVVTVDPPRPADAHDTFRPTALMERVSRLLEGSPAPMSVRSIREATDGKGSAVDLARRTLVAEGYLVESTGPHGSVLARSVRPYREANDRDDA